MNEKILANVDPYRSRGVNAHKTAADPIAGNNPPTFEISETENLIIGTLIIGVKNA